MQKCEICKKNLARYTIVYPCFKNNNNIKLKKSLSESNITPEREKSKKSKNKIIFGFENEIVSKSETMSKIENETAVDFEHKIILKSDSENCPSNELITKQKLCIYCYQIKHTNQETGFDMLM
jgi:hypothetical protein